MNLQQLLDLTGINRNTFNSWERKTGLRFMKERVTGEGRDRFTLSHAVALICVSRFLRMGVEIRRAESVVSEMFNFIDDRANSPRDEATWVTYVAHGTYSWGFAGGYGRAEDQWDLSTEEERAAEAVIRYSVDLAPILEQLTTHHPSEKAA